MKKKLLLLNVNRSGWHSGNMIYDMEAIKLACDTVIYGPGWPEYKTNSLPEIISQVYGNDKPDIIYSYFTPNEKVGKVYIDHYKIPEHLQNFPANFDKVKNIIKVFGLSDFWSRSPERYTKDLEGNPFGYCVCCFTPPYSNPKNFWSFFNNDIKKNMKFLAYPRCVDSKCFKKYGEKKLDIITTGAMTSFYPVRVWMHNSLKNEKMKYKNYPHSGVNFGHNGFVREKYARAISESKMLASCGGIYHLFFNKVIEAMGCETAYVGEKGYGFDELGFKDGENFIEVNKDNLIEKVRYYNNNEKELKNIINNGKELFLDRHTIEKRAVDFEKLMEGMS